MDYLITMPACQSYTLCPEKSEHP